MGSRAPLLLGIMLLALAETGRVFYIIFFSNYREYISGVSQKNIPEPKLSKFMGPTIRFMYCYSWGYQKVFQQYAGILQQKYPDISISGDNFPPGGYRWLSATYHDKSWHGTFFRLHAAQIISILKFIIILCVLASFNPFPFLGVDTPAWAAWMLENKIYACMMTFFLCNAVETQV